MTLWERIRSLFTRPDPEDDDDFLVDPEDTGPIPIDLAVPGETTQAMMIKRYPTPDEWDLLSERRKKRWMLAK